MKKILGLSMAIVLLLAASLAWNSRLKAARASGVVPRSVDRIGYHSIGPNGTYVRVFEDKNGKLNVETGLRPASEAAGKNAEAKNGNVMTRATEGFIDPKEPWCIYIENESTVWIYCSTEAEKRFEGRFEGGCLGLDRDALLQGRLTDIPAEFLEGIKKVRRARGDSSQQKLEKN